MLLLLLLLVVTVFVVPAVLADRLAGRLVMDVLITLLLLAGVLAVIDHRRLLPTLIVLSIVTIAVRWTEWIVPFDLLPAVRELSVLLVLLILGVAVGMNVFGADKAVVDRIMGAVVLYLLIGIQWAVAYEILNAHSPGAFAGGEGGEHASGHWFYFSFVTLTTVGYGDIVPVTRAARSLSTFEALMGQLYPAVVLARLISLPSGGRPPSPDAQV